MGAEVIILFNPYTYNFLKGLTHSAVMMMIAKTPFTSLCFRINRLRQAAELGARQQVA